MTSVTQATPGEIADLARALRAIGVAGFKYGEFECSFFEPLPLEMQETEAKQRVEGFAETDDDEPKETAKQKLARLRKEMADEDTFGAS